MNNFAVIKTGGKQYKVREDDVIAVEKLNAKEGEEVVFDEVLMRVEDGDVEIGKPFLNESKVKAEVVKHGKGEKKVVFKYKPKKRQRKKASHRQPFTAIKINSID